MKVESNVEVKKSIKKNKGFALISIIISVIIFGILVYSTYASEDVTSEDENMPPIFHRFGGHWLDSLTDEQRTTLKEMLEENRAEVQSQIEAWGVDFFELDEEQRQLLKSIMDENRAEIDAQLEEWGVEISFCPRPENFLSSLTDEQKEELQAMKQEFQEAVNAKLESWGIEVPEFQEPNWFGDGFHRRGIRGFDQFRP